LTQVELEHKHYVKINTKNVILWKQFVEAYFFGKINLKNLTQCVKLTRTFIFYSFILEFLFFQATLFLCYLFTHKLYYVLH